jgi:peptidoglycan/xylan/chitin deacetylase (PgdA/CDA1 family)
MLSLLWLILVLLLAYLWHHWQESKSKGLRILMYHKLDLEKADMLTVRVKDFEAQLEYLLGKGYQFASIRQLLSNPDNIPPKTLVLTFDDGYQNNVELALPVLKRLRLTACVFLPIQFVGQHNVWDKGTDQLMDWETLKNASDHFEYGLHSYSHRNMAQMTVAEFEQDIIKCLEEVKRQQLPLVPALAYPYGRFPKNKKLALGFERILKKHGIQLAFRIGNRINRLPIKNPYCLQRIDVRGNEPMELFKKKVEKGKLFGF